jgi:hypothetical protein
MSKPIPITDQHTLVQELISLSSSLNTGKDGNALGGVAHSLEHLQNIINTVVNSRITIKKIKG